MRTINGVSFSDVHKGHNRVPGESIRNAIHKALFPKLTPDTDILFIGGDFFDKLLDLSSLEGYNAVLVISELKAICEEYQILLRVLRGTFSHDRHQNNMFIANSDPKYIGNDLMVRVFDSISIEHIEHLDITVMYIPDDLPYDNAMPVIKRKLDEQHLTKVDFICNHGYFKHLIPKGLPHEPKNTFCANEMSELVKGAIWNGHIHQSSVYAKCITHGSFDRLAHNEEEAKGFFTFAYTPESGKLTYEFVENEYAALFATLDMTEYSNVNEAIGIFTAWVKSLVDRNKSLTIVRTRVISNDETIRHAAKQFIADNYQGKVEFKAMAHKHANEVKPIEHVSLADLPLVTEDGLHHVIASFAAAHKIADYTPDQVKEMMNRYIP